jgi:hypothetical protein
VEISQNFVAFSEYMNFTTLIWTSDIKLQSWGVSKARPRNYIASHAHWSLWDFIHKWWKSLLLMSRATHWLIA